MTYAFSLWTELPVIYLGTKEVQLDAGIMENVNQTPEEYYLYMEKETVEKEKYLGGLEQLFCENEAESETESHMLSNQDKREMDKSKAAEYRKREKKNKNRLRVLSDCIYEWYCSLPQCSTNFSLPEETEQIQEGLRVFRSLFRKLERNPREVLLERLPQAFSTGENFEKLLEDIAIIKEKTDGYLEKIKKNAVALTKEIFGFAPKDDLLQALKEWYRIQGSQAEHYVHTKQMGRFLNGIEKMTTHNEKEIAETLSRIVLDLYIEDWKENSLEQYGMELKKIKEEIEQIAAKEQTGESSAEGRQRIIFTNSKGQEVEKHFRVVSEEDGDGNEQFLQNEIESALEEFGDSLETDQKLAVMMKMIEKLLEEV